MSSSAINPDAVARAWAEKVSAGMERAGFPAQIVQENAFVIHNFVKTAAEDIVANNQLELPFEQQVVTFTPELANEVLELFVRSVNQLIKRVRDSQLTQPQRVWLMEQAAWETFRLAKLLTAVAQVSDPNALLSPLVSKNKDPKMMQSFKVLSNIMPIRELLASPKQGQRIIKHLTDATYERYEKEAAQKNL